MLARTGGLSRLLRQVRIKPSSRHNSSHHGAESHHPVKQGDGNAPIMTPGVIKSLVLTGGLYLFYTLDRSVAKKNDGMGIIHSLVERLDRKRASTEMTPEEYFAMIESARQRTKEHHESSQRPIYRSNYPEGANLANPYGLGPQDQAVRVQRTKSMWE